MKDKYEIPIWNHLNFALFYEMYDSYNRKNEDLKISELIDRVQKKIAPSKNLKDFYQFINAGSIFSLLYSNLVVPKELFENTLLGKKFFKSFEMKPEDHFDVIIGEKFLSDQFEFIRKLRNSIAHVNFKWDGERKCIWLWNQYKGSKNFEVKSDWIRLSSFCLKLSEFISKNQAELNKIPK